MDGTAPSPAGYAECVESFCGELGIERPAVAGFSMGGGIALELARRGSVSSAVAICPVGFWTPRERSFARGSIERLRRTSRMTPPAVSAALMRNPVSRTAALIQFYGRPWRVDPDAIIEGSAAQRDAPAFDAALDAFDDYTFHDAEELRGVPVTVAWGDRDFLLLSRQADRARKVLPWAAPCHAARLRAPAVLGRPRAAGRRDPGGSGCRGLGGGGRRSGGAAALGGADRRRREGRGDDHHDEGDGLDDDPDGVAGERVAEDDDPAGDARDVRGGAGDGDDLDGLAVLQALGRGVEGGGRGARGDDEPRAEEAEEAVDADDAGERLHGDVADAEEDAGGGREHHAVMLGRERRRAGP